MCPIDVFSVCGFIIDYDIRPVRVLCDACSHKTLEVVTDCAVCHCFVA